MRRARPHRCAGSSCEFCEAQVERAQANEDARMYDDDLREPLMDWHYPREWGPIR